MYEIEIADSQDILPIDQPFLREIAQKTLADERVVSAKISLALVDNSTIRELNRQYLNHDYDTDVLSFLLECKTANGERTAENEQQTIRRGSGKRIEGEVIISTETAARASKEYRWSAQNEVVLYLVHGLLHIVGYDDLSELNKQVMRSREREILSLFGLHPPYDVSEEVRSVSDETFSRKEMSGADS